MRIKTFLRSENFRAIAILTILSAMAYLPFVHKFSYTHDDWYLMYAAKVRGASIFHMIFNEDRPMRALVMSPAYLFFGDNPLYYNLSAYFFRLLSGLGFLWILRLLWAKERVATLLMALLFVLYPGFLSMPNGIDYQSQMVALAAAIFSLALTIKSFQASRFSTRIIFFVLSALLSWFYLGLVEYFIGLEAVRLLLIITLVLREQAKWQEKIRRGIWRIFPFLFTSLPFIYWRFFIFKSERGATDIGKQFSGFFSDPYTQLFIWISHLFEDSIAVLWGAWKIPFTLFHHITPKLLDGIIFFFWFLVIAGIFSQLYFFLQKKRVAPKNTSWQIEVLLIGLFSLVICQLPIILVNRQVSFPTYSRYALSGSFGAVMILVALLYIFREKYIRLGFSILLIMVALLTHSANSKRFSTETEIMNNFWWQVSWRVPHFEERTTLVANYPVVATEEDYFIWGPANQIYYPEGTSERVVQTGVYALILNKGTIEKVKARERQEYDNRRGIESYPNARNILILTQPTLNSCVQVIDGFAPEYSSLEKADIKEIGDFSEVEHILTDAEPHLPPEVVFGPEPDHAWCYIYQKATLARQRGDWDAVAALDQQASENALAPQDSVEWLPFIQAGAMLGDAERIQEIALSIKNEPFILEQACKSLKTMELKLPMQTLSESVYCVEQ